MDQLWSHSPWWATNSKPVGLWTPPKRSNLLVSATSLNLISEIIFESLATNRVRAAKTTCYSRMCIIGIVTYLRTIIVLLVAVNELMGETVVTPPLGSFRPSTIHLSGVEGCFSLLASSIFRSRMSNLDGTFSLRIHGEIIKLRRPNENGEYARRMWLWPSL